VSSWNSDSKSRIEAAATEVNKHDVTTSFQHNNYHTHTAVICNIHHTTCQYNEQQWNTHSLTYPISRLQPHSEQSTLQLHVMSSSKSYVYNIFFELVDSILTGLHTSKHHP